MCIPPMHFSVAGKSDELPNKLHTILECNKLKAALAAAQRKYRCHHRNRSIKEKAQDPRRAQQ